jgi:anti-sigma factor RsiW
VAELTCQDLVELVTDYLDGALDKDVAVRFEQHLAICPGCRTYVDQMAQTASLLGEIPADTLSQEMQASLLDAFRDFDRFPPEDGPTVDDMGTAPNAAASDPKQSRPPT